jgi:hypothetical protein
VQGCRRGGPEPSLARLVRARRVGVVHGPLGERRPDGGEVASDPGATVSGGIARTTWGLVYGAPERAVKQNAARDPRFVLTALGGLWDGFSMRSLLSAFRRRSDRSPESPPPTADPRRMDCRAWPALAEAGRCWRRSTP